MLAYFLNTLSPFIWEIRPGFGPRWYGLAYVLAFVAAYAICRRLAERGYSQLPPEKVDGFITGVALFGVMLGGRVGHFVFYAWDDLVGNPLSFFKVWEGGMASHGGMLGVLFFTLYYSHRHKLSWPGLGDSIVVVTPLGLFFGRIANFINGELYGRATKVAWAVQFPSELLSNPRMAGDAGGLISKAIPVPLEKGQMDLRFDTFDAIMHAARHDERARDALRKILTPRHPSQIYEALLEGAALFAILWFLRTKTRQPRGVITGVFFILYAVARIFCECFREPGDPLIGVLTRGQFLSLFLIFIGAAFIIYGRKAKQYERAVL